MRLLWLAPGLSFLATFALAQYPPGQYPGQYPPGGYPPNTIPAAAIPGRLSGRRLPRRKLSEHLPDTAARRRAGRTARSRRSNFPSAARRTSRNRENEVKVTMAAVDGALRKLGEKDLVLQAGPKKLLRFRLLAKTQFRDKEGEAGPRFPVASRRSALRASEHRRSGDRIARHVAQDRHSRRAVFGRPAVRRGHRARAQVRGFGEGQERHRAAGASASETDGGGRACVHGTRAGWVLARSCSGD